MNSSKRMKNTAILTGKISLSVIFAFFTIFSFIQNAYSTGDSITAEVSATEDGDYTSVVISGVLTIDGMPKQGAIIGVVVVKDGTSNIFADEITTDTDGEYETHFRILTENAGIYTVYATPASSYVENLVAEESFNIGCAENWVCGGWSECNANLVQTRTCVDQNECGTTASKPAISRSCTCAIQGGDICGTSETCNGYFIDATDTSRCCDGVCKTQSTSSSSSGGSGSTTTTTMTTTSNDDEDEDENTDTTTATDNDYDDEQTENIINEQDTEYNDTAATNITGSMNTTDASANNGETENTPTGMIESVVGNSRWIFVDIILIIMIIVLAGKILAKPKSREEKKEQATKGWSNGKYSFGQSAGHKQSYEPAKKTIAKTAKTSPITSNGKLRVRVL